MVDNDLGFRMPTDFALRNYEKTKECVVDYYERVKMDWARYVQFASAWTAVAYRFRACAENESRFSFLINNFTDAPKPHDRYLQERKLFEFFYNSHSCLECCYYAIYVIGNFVNEQNFPIGSEDQENINPHSTADKFMKYFESDIISRTLDNIIRDPGWKKWRTLRNVTTHRRSPGRTYTTGNVIFTQWQLSLDEVTEEMVKPYRIWFAKRLNTLIRRAYKFASSKLA